MKRSAALGKVEQNMRYRRKSSLVAAVIVATWLGYPKTGIFLEESARPTNAPLEFEVLNLTSEEAATPVAPSASLTPLPQRIRIQRNLQYSNQEGTSLKATLYVPTEQKRHPGVLLIHGGAWCAGSRTELAWHARKLAEAGYVAASIDYRLAPKYKFPAQIDDCRTALAWFIAHADEWNLDPDRIGLYGYSAGGHLACLLGLSPPDARAPRVKAIIAGGAPCDFRIVPPDEDLLSYWLGGTRVDCPGMYAKASPLAMVSADDPPTFFFGGDRDWLVPPITARRTSHDLRQLRVPSEFFRCKGQGHLGALMNYDAFERALDFLDRYLKEDHDRPRP